MTIKTTSTGGTATTEITTFEIILHCLWTKNGLYLT